MILCFPVSSLPFLLASPAAGTLLARCLHSHREHAKRSRTADNFFHCCMADPKILQQRQRTQNRGAWLNNSHVSGPENNVREMMYGPCRFRLLGAVLCEFCAPKPCCMSSGSENGLVCGRLQQSWLVHCRYSGPKPRHLASGLHRHKAGASRSS